MSTVAKKGELEALATEAELDKLERERFEALAAELDSPREALAQIMAEREEAANAEPSEAAALAVASGEPSTKQLKQLDTESERHLTAVYKIMGPFVEGFEPCEQCGGMGLTPPNAPRTNENFTACPTCGGWGEVLTGSKRGGHESRDCPECRGRGYLELLDASGAPLVAQSNGAQLPTPVPVVPTVTLPEGVTVPGQQEPRYGTPAWMGDVSVGG